MGFWWFVIKVSNTEALICTYESNKFDVGWTEHTVNDY